MQKVFEMEKIDLKNNKKILVQLAWISGVIHSQNLEEVNQGTGEITLMFNPLLKDYLLELNGFYTQYKLCNVLSMKSKYSPRIYELLKSNEYQKKGFVIEIKELRRMFKAEEIYPLYADFKKYDVGDIIGVKGEVFKTKTGEISVHASEVELLTKSLQVLPEKFHGLTNTDLRYRQRYVDLIMNPEVKDTFIKRSKILTAIRKYLGNEQQNIPISFPYPDIH